MKLKFLRDHVGCYGKIFESGTIHEYCPWNHEWQNMTEPERVSKNIFVECHGQGEFDVFTSDDVAIN